MLSPEFAHLFQQIAALLLVSAAVGALALKLKQPLVVAFIAVGVLLGRSGLNWVGGEQTELVFLADLGIALLLFVVGLKLDVGLIRTLGKVALATGVGQIVFTSVFGYLIARLLGMEPLSALYVAVALTFSSTIIIVKLLSDKREIDALHGRIAVGFLIVQDIAVVLIMIALSAFAETAGEAGIGWRLLETALKGAALLVVIGLLMKFVLPRLMHALAHSQELLVLFAIAWAATVAAVSDALGFSKEVGAFLAGVSLASTDYREVVSARMVSVRDFLLLFFFLNLGAQIDLSLTADQVAPALVLSVFVLVGNPIIVMAIMGWLGYRRRTGFLAGLTVAQISEFSLILGALGVSLGHIGQDTLGLITLVGLVTIGLSTYMILYSQQLYRLLSPWLRIFERDAPRGEHGFEAKPGPTAPEVILFGLGRFGGAIGRALRRDGVRVLGVDFDPHAVSDWRREEGEALYGDAEDPEFASHLPLAGVRSVVSTVPQLEINVVLINSLRRYGFEGRILVTAHNERDAERAREVGADVVLLPFVEAAHGAVRAIVDPRPA